MLSVAAPHFTAQIVFFLRGEIQSAQITHHLFYYSTSLGMCQTPRSTACYIVIMAIPTAIICIEFFSAGDSMQETRNPTSLALSGSSYQRCPPPPMAALDPFMGSCQAITAPKSWSVLTGSFGQMKGVNRCSLLSAPRSDHGGDIYDVTYASWPLNHGSYRVISNREKQKFCLDCPKCN